MNWSMIQAIASTAFLIIGLFLLMCLSEAGYWLFKRYAHHTAMQRYLRGYNREQFQAWYLRR